MINLPFANRMGIFLIISNSGLGKSLWIREVFMANRITDDFSHHIQLRVTELGMPYFPKIIWLLSQHIS